MRRLARLVVLIVALVAAIVALVVWLVPGRDSKALAVSSACGDAAMLRHARLLDEARLAYAAIADVEDDSPCQRGGVVVAEADAEAARARERGDVYLRAARFKEIAGVRDGRRRAIGRARNAYIASLTLDPFAERARRGLRRVIRELERPVDRASANGRCEIGQQLRQARLLREAQLAYAQALRSGRNSRCVAAGLRLLRKDRATTQRWLKEARALKARDRKERARFWYVAALTMDPALTEARRALADLRGPDPREGQTWGRVEALAADVDPVFDGMGDVATWFTDNAPVFAVTAIVLLLLTLLTMFALLALTNFKPGRTLVAWFHTPRFTRRKMIVAAFTPSEDGHTTTALFAHWLPEPPVDPNGPGDEAVLNSDAALDLWEAPALPNDPLEGAMPLLALSPQLGAAAAVGRWVQSQSPRREYRFVGQTLEACDHGVGLRLVVTTRKGRSTLSNVWWANQLPGPAYDDDHEAEARHALALKAAAWAHDAATT